MVTREKKSDREPVRGVLQQKARGGCLEEKPSMVPNDDLNLCAFDKHKNYSIEILHVKTN